MSGTTGALCMCRAQGRAPDCGGREASPLPPSLPSLLLVCRKCPAWQAALGLPPLLAVAPLCGGECLVINFSP